MSADCLLTAIVAVALVNVTWLLGFVLAFRRLRGKFTVVLSLPEVGTAITVHQVGNCRDPDAALTTATASKLRVSLAEAKTYLDRNPHRAFVCVGHHSLVEY